MAHQIGDRDNRLGDGGDRADRRYKRSGRGIGPWLLALLVIAILVVGGFFLFGGDVDSDTEGDFDVDVPSADVDVDGPDVDVETPDVDVDPGSVDVTGGNADADADAGS